MHYARLFLNCIPHSCSKLGYRNRKWHTLNTTTQIKKRNSEQDIHMSDRKIENLETLTPMTNTDMSAKSWIKNKLARVGHYKHYIYIGGYVQQCTCSLPFHL